ncbi:MAG: winged helix-turn-helix transcriptional regulator [Thaumarchaeota archaeon]|nr:winged helix-turn-helix transcriptional regulator [Nitrososphaerota archaeon]
MRVRFYREFETSAREICVALAQLAYLAYFARLMPENEWVLHFQIPLQHQHKLSELLTKLEELHVLTMREAYLTDLRIVPPFRGEYFDPEVMRFRFDWGAIKGPAPVPDESALYYERAAFDSTDLRIVEMMQIEPLNVSEIARRTGLDKWTCYWHWKHHVRGKIFRDWYVDWLGTWMLDKDDFTAMSRREYGVADIFGKSLSSYEMQRLREKFYALPYLVSEVIGKTDIVAQFFIPNESLGDAFDLFGSMDDTMQSKIAFRMEDQGNAIAFTIPANLYDDQEGWTFEIETLVAGFRRLVVELRENKAN